MIKKELTELVNILEDQIKRYKKDLKQGVRVTDYDRGHHVAMKTILSKIKETIVKGEQNHE